jgi:hypothetical protein
LIIDTALGMVDDAVIPSVCSVGTSRPPVS